MDSLLGIVLWELIRSFNFTQTGAVMLIIVLAVTLIGPPRPHGAGCSCDPAAQGLS